MNIVVPMAGEGLRLKDGFKMPKPFININNKPMFSLALQHFNKDDNFIFIVRKDHAMAKDVISKIYPKAIIIYQDEKLDGAVKTIKLVEDLINNEDPLMIIDCDVYSELKIDDFINSVKKGNDGGVVTFESSDPSYSYIKTKNVFAIEIAEKQVISNDAIGGIFFWLKGSDYVKYSNILIEKNIKINNEFYVSMVLNEAVKDNKKIIPFAANKFFHLGTVKEIDLFIKENGEAN
jgi:NDP-sugar pyrophosphorylase family protein